ncbi:hypothetical protein LO772_25445 [Yinghuangia sp. ASG 101]|uniref:hypothetical protein n=1 Tax=Yinghuangia sp. ASG 101 TaxID=2896848 RepID=UPI001E54B399|nr:hypothetical protein [Yinghuangia sp. ASG 101]UGQ10201.1 hypothetical protein LO772_25445 [Yinghuangia sp. ASG 101]
MEGSERRRRYGEVRVAVIRDHGGWIVALVGAVLCVLGWYGVSGEKHEARQIPYLASATVPGAALIVAGAVLVGARLRADGGAGSDAALRRQVAELHALVVEPADADPDFPDPADSPPERPSGGATRSDLWEDRNAPFVALPAGARYHRPDCPLVAGKNGVHAVGARQVAELDLRACALCDPDDTGETPAAPGAAGPRADPDD